MENKQQAARKRRQVLSKPSERHNRISEQEANRSKGTSVFEKKKQATRKGPREFENKEQTAKGTKGFVSKEQTKRKKQENLQTRSKPLYRDSRIQEQRANRTRSKPLEKDEEIQKTEQTA